MRNRHIQHLTHILSLVFLDPMDRAAYQSSCAAMLAQVPEDERLAQLPDLLLGLPGEALASNRASDVACARAQRGLHLVMLPAAAVLLTIGAVQIDNALQVIGAADNAQRLDIAVGGAAQIQAIGPVWALAASVLAVLIPVSWMLHPHIAAFRVHVLLLLPLLVAVSTLPGLAVPPLATLAGWLLAALALWCVVTRPEDTSLTRA